MVFTSRPPDFLKMHLTVEGDNPLPPPRPDPVIGVVVFPTHRGERAEAILDGEGRWRCPKLPVLDRVLNILFEPKRVGQGGKAFGKEALERVAEWLKGRVVAEREEGGDNPGD